MTKRGRGGLGNEDVTEGWVTTGVQLKIGTTEDWMEKIRWSGVAALKTEDEGEENGGSTCL